MIYCPGAVSHVDTFDYKPELVKYHGQKPPGIPAVTFEGPTGNIAKPFWNFKPRGESGKMISELLPNMAELADEFCFIHSLTTQTSAHPQGENFMNTGFTMEGFPSFGAWVTYALGSDCNELPAFVAINDPRGMARSGKNNFGSAFLPASFQGTDFNAKNPPSNLARPDKYTNKHERQTLDLLKKLILNISRNIQKTRILLLGLQVMNWLAKCRCQFPRSWILQVNPVLFIKNMEQNLVQN